MLKLIFMLKRKDGMMSRGLFRTHCEGSHVNLAKRSAGHMLESYERNYFNEISAPPIESGADTNPFQYDVITEMRLKDQAWLTR